MGKRVIVNTTPHMRLLSVGESIGRWPVIETVPGSPVTAIEFPDGTTDEQQEQYLQELESAHLICEVDDMLARDVQGGYKPMGDVHTLADPTFAPGDTFAMIGVQSDTQARGKWGASVRIGLVDTGCDFGHPWFSGKDLAGDGGDTIGHGTFCAGIMVGNQGVASDASLLVKSALRSGTGTEVDIARGIRECAEAGCQVINLSLGGAPSPLMDAACRYASQLGAIVVTAAGNTPNAAIGSPAQASDVIVLAIDRDRKYAIFTSGTNWSNKNRTVAPGVNDVSATPGGGVSSGSGTSFAAPHVSAMLALLRASGLSRADTLTYLWAHRTGGPDKLCPVLVAGDFGVDPGAPPDPEWLDDVRQRLQLIRDLVARAQYDRCPWDAEYDEYRDAMVQIMDHDLGPIVDVVGAIEANLPKETEPTPQPPPPEPTPQGSLPLADGAVYGKTKWLQGSLGCDLFVKRGEPVYSPDNCVVELVLGGTGLEGGAEVIVSKPDHSWSWRYRHVRATVRVGDMVSRGKQVAIVSDASMDMLGRTPPGFPAPDNYQHLDLSVNKGTNQFSPLGVEDHPMGGGGGNYSAYQWLTDLGYRGTVVQRTPGPNDGVRAVEEKPKAEHVVGPDDSDTAAVPPGRDIKAVEAKSGREKPKRKPGRPAGSLSKSKGKKKTEANLSSVSEAIKSSATEAKHAMESEIKKAGEAIEKAKDKK